MDAYECSQNDHYFPFTDMIEDLVTLLSRDEYIYRNSVVVPHERIDVELEDRTTHTHVPICGIYPYKGFASFVLPLSLVYNNPGDIYFVSREMICRYWCKLLAIRSDDGCLISLYKTFEELLQFKEPELFYRMIQLGVQPLTIADQWISNAFVGFMQPREVLLLWDRILGFDTLLLLPIMAVSIFMFRATFVQKASSESEIREIFSDNIELKTVPLLQYFFIDVKEKSSTDA